MEHFPKMEDTFVLYQTAKSIAIKKSKKEINSLNKARRPGGTKKCIKIAEILTSFLTSLTSFWPG